MVRIIFTTRAADFDKIYFIYYWIHIGIYVRKKNTPGKISMQLHFIRIVKEIAVLAVTVSLAVGVGLYGPKIYKSLKSNVKYGDYSAQFRDARTSLILYGTTTCEYCKKTRAYLKLRNLPFDDLLVDESKVVESDFNRLKIESVPVLVTRGALVVGYREKDYEKMLEH